MVELEFYSRPATAAMPPIPGPNELLDVVRNRTSSGCLWLRADSNRRLSGRNSLLFTLMSSDEEGIDLILFKIVVVRVDAMLEPPIIALIDTTHAYRRRFRVFLH